MRFMMTKHRRLLVPAALAAFGAGLVLSVAQAPANAETENREPRRCLSGGNYDSTIVDKETVILTDRSLNSVKVKVKGCSLNDFEPLMFVFRGTNQICDPIDIDMSTITSPGFKSYCFVQSVTPMPRKARGEKPQAAPEPSAS